MSHRSIKKSKTGKLNQCWNDNQKSKPLCNWTGSAAGSQEKKISRVLMQQSSSESWRGRKSEDLLKTQFVFEHTSAQWYCNPDRDSQVTVMIFHSKGIVVIYAIKFYRNYAVFGTVSSWITFHSLLELSCWISQVDVSLYKLVICSILSHRTLPCLRKQNIEKNWQWTM